MSCLVVVAACLLAPAAALFGQTAGDRPNMVFIMADDLGWSNLGCTGSAYYESPHIDRLARQGVTFTSYYVCQNCAPTRAALMSGQYAPRTGVYTVGSFRRGKDAQRKMVTPENRTRLPLDKITIAQRLARAGYVTGMFGKWHLGRGPQYHPATRGFDEVIVTSGRHFGFKTDPLVPTRADEYLADFLTDRAVDFIERHKGRPFFLYLPHFAVHSPIVAKEPTIAKYRRKPPAGGHNDPVYAAMIESMDQSGGRIFDKLDELGLSVNTLVIFCSDNGGVDGYQVPGTNRTNGRTDNAPLRGGKGTLYDGGVRVPFIARWPAVIPPGGRCDQPAAHVDVFPTLLKLAGASNSTDHVLDEVSLTTLFRAPSAGREREAIYWHFPGYLESYIPEVV